VGIVRVSGPRALHIARVLTGRHPEPRRALHAHFKDATGDVLDDGIVLVFAGPRSFTGEDVAEFQGHGGPVVLRLVLDAVLAAGARLARAGEFTERAFLNGKLDLAQAEAVADLIASGSAAAARGAVRSLQGVFSRAVNQINELVLGLRVFVEAALDFPDEAVEFLASGQVAARMQTIADELNRLISDTRQGVLLRDGVVIALVGAPNVGKSSLLNRLAQQDRAIVSEVPGTTRDTIDVELVLDGLPCHVVDTAGIRASDDVIEREGMRRSAEQASRADIVLVLEDARDAQSWSRSVARSWLAEQALAAGPARVIRVFNKVDLLGHSTLARGTLVDTSDDVPDTVAISALNGTGVSDLIRSVHAKAGFMGEAGTYTARTRHVLALRLAADALGAAQTLLRTEADPELIAEELRHVHGHLGEIVGTLSADDLLGEIFSRFCIGK
jgi:tRNA modification GTPase